MSYEQSMDLFIGPRVPIIPLHFLVVSSAFVLLFFTSFPLWVQPALFLIFLRFEFVEPTRLLQSHQYASKANTNALRIGLPLHSYSHLHCASSHLRYLHQVK